MAKKSEGPTSTREKILDAGIDLCRQQTPDVLLGGLSVARVSEAAHVTRSTFYSYWPSSEEYLNDLVGRLAERDDMNYPAIARASGRAPYPPIPSTDIPRRIINDCAVHFEAAIIDPTLSARWGFLSKADDPKIAGALRDLYRRSEEAQYAPFAESLEHWGRELREPFDEEMIKIVFSSLFEGLAARFRVEPERFTTEIYGLVILPLLLTLTKRPDDKRTLFEIVDSINSFSAIGLAGKLREHETLAGSAQLQISTGSMREVTIAIRRLLARVGFGELSISQIAVVTGYSELSLHQMYGSRPGIALCLLFINIFERAQDNPDGLSGLRRIRQLLEINFDEMKRNPALGQNVMMLLSGHTAAPRLDLVDFDPRPFFDTAVADAIRDGELHRHIDASQLSFALQRTILVEGSLIGSPSNAISTVELMLKGAGAAPIEQHQDSGTS